MTDPEKLKAMSMQELLFEANRIHAEMLRQSAETLNDLNTIKLEMMSRQLTTAK